jgi:hypothetical protein
VGGLFIFKRDFDMKQTNRITLSRSWQDVANRSEGVAGLPTSEHGHIERVGYYCQRWADKARKLS